MMNSDGDIETIVKKLLEGPGDVSIVPLGAAVEVAEALAEAENVSLLSDLMERMLPRLTKKERFDEIETLWIAACTIGAIRRPVMMRTIEKLVGREMVDEAGELLMMLVDAVIEAEGDEEALEITTESLAWSKSEGFIACAARSLENLFGEVKGFSVILARFEREAPEEGVEAMERASRALRFAPGTFLRLSDWTIARVHSTDGVTAKISHPSGSLEERRVDEKPPPKVLSPAGHEVRALFDTEALSKQWIDNPGFTGR